MAVSTADETLVGGPKREREGEVGSTPRSERSGNGVVLSSSSPHPPPSAPMRPTPRLTPSRDNHAAAPRSALRQAAVKRVKPMAEHIEDARHTLREARFRSLATGGAIDRSRRGVWRRREATNAVV